MISIFSKVVCPALGRLLSGVFDTGVVNCSEGFHETASYFMELLERKATLVELSVTHFFLCNRIDKSLDP